MDLAGEKPRKWPIGAMFMGVSPCCGVLHVWLLS